MSIRMDLGKVDDEIISGVLALKKLGFSDEDIQEMYDRQIELDEGRKHMFEIYSDAMNGINAGAYSQFKARQSQMNPKNWGVYGRAKSTGRWRAITDCAPDQKMAEDK